MKILVVSNYYPPVGLGGYEIACSQMVDALRSRGHDVRVLASPAGLPAADVPAHVIRSLHLNPVFDTETVAVRPVRERLALEAASFWLDVHNVEVLVEQLDGFAPDVAYLWNTVGLGGLALVTALQRLGVPWVWHLADSVPWQLMCERGAPVPGVVGGWNDLITGSWVCVSNRLRWEIESQGVGLHGRVTGLPLWVVLEGLEPIIPAPATDGRPLRLAFAGQVGEQKGAHIAVESIELLARRGIDARLDLWGHILDATLPSRAVQLGVGDRVTFHGSVPHREVISGVRECDMLLFPTWSREPFGMVGAEAAAMGTVPVMSDCGLAEWMTNGEHCIMVERSAAGLADGVCTVVDGRLDLPSIARLGAAHVRTTMTIDYVVPFVEQLLADAMTTGPSRSLDAREARRVVGIAKTAARLIDGINDQRWA